MLTGVVFVFGKCRNMAGVFDLGTSIKASRVRSDDLLSIQKSHLLEICRDRQCALYIVVGYRIIINPSS